MAHQDTNAAALKRVETPPRGVYLARNACYNCNHNLDLIIFPTLIETEGQLALCSRCIKRAAKLLDLQNVATLQALITDLRHDVEKLEQVVQDQAVVISSYEALHAARGRLTSQSVPSSVDGDQPLPGLEDHPVPQSVVDYEEANT